MSLASKFTIDLSNNILSWQQMTNLENQAASIALKRGKISYRMALQVDPEEKLEIKARKILGMYKAKSHRRNRISRVKAVHLKKKICQTITCKATSLSTTLTSDLI